MALSKKAPNPIDKHVGARVRMRRMILSMSQEKLGDALGLTSQQVQKYEKGTNRIGASRLQQISTILQVEPSFFFAGAPGVSAPHPPAGLDPDPVQTAVSTRDGLALIQAFVRIEAPAERAIVVQMAQTLANRQATRLKKAA